MKAKQTFTYANKAKDQNKKNTNSFSLHWWIRYIINIKVIPHVDVIDTNKKVYIFLGMIIVG